MKYLISCCLLLLVILGLTICLKRAEAVKKEDPFTTLSLEDRQKLAVVYHDSAKYFRQGGEMNEAFRDTAIMLDANNAEILFEESVWKLKTGNYVEQMKYLNKAVELSPIDHLGYRGHFKLVLLRDYRGAIRDLERLDSLTPGVVDYAWAEHARYQIGLAKKQLGDYEGAIVEIDRYIADITAEQGEDWADVYAFMYRGICNRELGNKEEAMKDMEKMIHYCESCPEAYYWKGILLVDRGEQTAACRMFQKAWDLRGQIKTDAYHELFDELHKDDINKKIDQYCVGMD